MWLKKRYKMNVIYSSMESYHPLLICSSPSTAQKIAQQKTSRKTWRFWVPMAFLLCKTCTFVFYHLNKNHTTKQTLKNTYPQKSVRVSTPTPPKAKVQQCPKAKWRLMVLEEPWPFREINMVTSQPHFFTPAEVRQGLSGGPVLSHRSS